MRSRLSNSVRRARDFRRGSTGRRNEADRLIASTTLLGGVHGKCDRKQLIPRKACGGMQRPKSSYQVAKGMRLLKVIQHERVSACVRLPGR
jgi:hypothetical protein